MAKCNKADNKNTLGLPKSYIRQLMGVKRMRSEIAKIQTNHTGRSLHPSEYEWVDLQTSIIQCDIDNTNIMIGRLVLLLLFFIFISLYSATAIQYFTYLAAGSLFIYALLLRQQQIVKIKRAHLNKKKQAQYSHSAQRIHHA